MKTAWTFHAVIAGALLAAAPATTDAAEDKKLHAQRSAFLDVYPEVERGHWESAVRYERLLDDYVLWPDLQAAYLRAHLATVEHARISSFLDQYGLLKPARELRYAYALHLAEEGHFAEFQEIYRQHYSDLGVARLDCIALHAEIGKGSSKEVVERGLQLWLTGTSQEDECDPVFAHLRSTGALTDEHYRQRYALAIEKRRFSLARYLSEPLSDDYANVASNWIKARDESLRFVQGHNDLGNDDTARQQLAYAIERIAFQDPLLAKQHWVDLQKSRRFAAEQRQTVDRHIALWAARRQLDEAGDLLFALPPEAVDSEVRRWMVRSSLRREDWSGVLREIASMPGDEQQKDEWLFWEAMALRHTDQVAAAEAKLDSLSTSRSFYGFLAADMLGKDYVFAHKRMIPDDEIAENLLKMPALMRSRELFHVGLEGRGRSEWDAVIGTLRPYEQVQAAILAHHWGWHSRAIATASLIGEFDDLEIRYPLPWREEIGKSSERSMLDDSLVYGIARSESLFMRDIRSSAGAVGIMQLLPQTARRIARQLGQPWYGAASLTDRNTNIRLGTVFLGKMLERFNGNRVLATAAYNAGPLNVDEWLPQNGRVDTRIWIENIPYDETRDYVRRVLTADTIFHWRLTGETKRLSANFAAIEPPTDAVVQVD